jgi:RNA polymerase sigma-70 factor (ECF subfamily)
MPAVNRDRSGGVLLRLAPELTDEQLVRAAVAGDRKAEEALILRHAPRVTRVLSRILGSDPEVVDQAQEVMLRALRDLPTLREPRAFRSWLTTLAVMRARRVLRRRARWRWLLGERVPIEEQELADDRDEAGRAALVAVYEVLSKLGEEERTAFALRFLEGMELTEVAASMGLSLATVKRRLADASKRFGLLSKHQPALVPWLASSRFSQPEDP